VSDIADPPLVAGAVLVGGSSRRMGTDKSLIEIDGAPMAQRCAIALRAAGASPVLIVGGDSTAYESWDAVHVADEWPGAGPLGAIITAFRKISADLLMVVPCDLLDPAAESIEDVIKTIGSHDAVVPIVAGRQQWLFSVWHRRALPVLEAEFARGTRSIHSAASTLDLYCPVVVQDADGPDSYSDADTPDQLGARRPRSAG